MGFPKKKTDLDIQQRSFQFECCSEIFILRETNRIRVKNVPAFSHTVPDQFKIVYMARAIAPTGSIHQKILSPRIAATNPTTFVTTSK